MHSHCIRAIASVTAKYQKMVNFTHFNKKKHPHQCLQNCAYMQKCYSNHAYMHDYCSFAYQYFINFTFRSFFFLSSPSAKSTHLLSLIIFFFLWYIHSHKHKIKNQPQTPQNQTHSHTDTPIETKRVDRHLWQIGVCGSVSFNHGGSAPGSVSDREWREEFQMGNGERVWDNRQWRERVWDN